MKKILYLDIYDYVIKKIKDKSWPSDFKIPSKRKLSKAFNVSVITVANALEQLESEGYIYSKQRVGYFVCNMDIITMDHINNKKIEKPNELNKSQCVFDFRNNNGDILNFPFNIWQRIERKIIIDNKNILINKPQNFGELTLRKAISNYLNNNLAMNISYKQVIITSGSENSYNLLVNYFGRKQKYGLEDPGYKNISMIYKLNDLDYSYIPLDKKGIDINLLKQSKVDIVHLSTNHHYPSGIVMPISRRYELIKWAKEKKSFIIEDDYDVELRLKGKLINPLFTIDDQNVIYLSTFSLTLNPCFRIAYILLPEKLIKSYEEKMSFFKCNVSILEQLTLAEFINSGSYERYLNKKKKRYQVIRNSLMKKLIEISFKHNLILKEADLGLHILITYPYKISETQVMEIANSLKIKIYPLSHFMNNKKDTKTLIVNYSCFNNDNLEFGIKCLEKLFNAIEKA